MSTGADPPNAPRLGPLLLAGALVGIVAGFGGEALHEDAGAPRLAAGLFAGALIGCVAPLARWLGGRQHPGGE